MAEYRTIYLWMSTPDKIHDATDPETGEVSATYLAEEAAEHFGHPEWLDDEAHEVWEAAAVVAQENAPSLDDDWEDDDPDWHESEQWGREDY